MAPRTARSFLSLLLTLIGVGLLLSPLAFWASEELAYRREMAAARTPRPIMLLPATSAGQEPPPVDAAPPTPQEPAPATTPPPAAEPPTPVPTPVSSGYWIEIPRIGISYQVGEGIDDPVLAKGPGHYPQTPLPGSQGNAALAGHRTIRGRPAFFHALDRLAPDDEIQIRYADQTLVYAVERVYLTDPSDLSVLSPTPYAALTLTTCDPPGSDEMRLIVRARLLSPQNP